MNITDKCWQFETKKALIKITKSLLVTMSLKINKNDDLLEAPIYFIELTFKFDIMNINGQCRQFKTRKALKI